MTSDCVVSQIVWPIVVRTVAGTSPSFLSSSERMLSTSGDFCAFRLRTASSTSSLSTYITRRVGGWGPLPRGTLAPKISVQCFLQLASSGRSKVTVKPTIRLLSNTNQKLLLDSNWLKCLCELRSIAKAVFAVFDYTQAEMSPVMYNHRWLWYKPQTLSNRARIDRAAKDFMQCASTAARTCNILPPASEVSDLPTLSGLAPITEQLCTGESLTSHTHTTITL